MKSKQSIAMVAVCFCTVGIGVRALLSPQRTQAQGSALPPAPAVLNSSQSAAGAIAARPRLFHRSTSASVSLPREELSGDPDIPQELYAGIRSAYPDAGWSPSTETISAYCDRVPHSEHIVYRFGDGFTVAALSRTVDEDGWITCDSESMVKIAEDAPGVYTVMSDAETRIPVDEESFVEEPVLTMHVDAQEMSVALSEVESWLRLFRTAHGRQDDDVSDPDAKRILLEIRFRTMEYLLNEDDQKRFARLNADVWRALWNERLALEDEMLQLE